MISRVMNHDDGFRLGNQVVIVEGAHAIALYDLKKGFLQRLPGTAGAVVRRCCSLKGQALPLDSAESDLMLRLLERGFVEKRRGAEAEPFSADWRVPPLFPPLRTLSFALDGTCDPERTAVIRMLVSEASDRFGLLSIVLLLQDGADETSRHLAEDLITAHEYLFVEVHGLSSLDLDCWSTERTGLAGADRLSLFGGRSAPTPVGDRLVSVKGDRISPDHFFVNAGYYHLVKGFGDSHGCLHFDAQLRVFPDIAEAHYCVGIYGATHQTLDDLLDDPRLTAYWSVTKDLREKCKDCEFRYACANPLAHRTEVERLTSAPSNCDYDLATGTWSDSR